ncbi:Transmembrane protein 87A [Frankliniella fusca]|uniref:Transmembrane protein 87A n=1 Tax=Frankliniella fusca TaxID=407009 RepID=A0AAE1I0B1_9NEOP|nr:Transmembrane protein 87A [Frankliniella fusca]
MTFYENSVLLLRLLLLKLLLLSALVDNALSEGNGKWAYELSDVSQYVTVYKSLFKGSQIFIVVSCDNPELNVSIQWNLTQFSCWQDFASFPDGMYQLPEGLLNHTLRSPVTQHQCIDHVILTDLNVPTTTPFPDKTSFSPVETQKSFKDSINPNKLNNPTPIHTIEKDGLYSLVFHIFPSDGKGSFRAPIKIEMLSHYGYLSATAWPLLPFYGIMCLMYVLFGIGWLTVSFCQWRDLLRIQFWIGGVILLGMLEKAVFYAEYQSINSRGTSVEGAVLFAELVSCAKRTLARMLVIIVSLGFGIVKPRLGAMLHRVVSSGVLYFVLASVESYKRIMGSNVKNGDLLMASVPLALLDSAFCWWIFSNLVQTMRTLRLRRNLVKLSLYRHFSNALYFSVLASCCFMLYSIRYHHLNNCLSDWKELWVDQAYWHILFSLILLVIMILWRPTNNNQRYAFTPLLDNPEDEDDEEEQFVSDAFGLKMRGSNTSTSPKPKSSTTEEEDLKWVEDNIPAYLSDSALPILDSDEETANTKFEVSKMQ